MMSSDNLERGKREKSSKAARLSFISVSAAVNRNLGLVPKRRKKYVTRGRLVIIMM